MRPTLIFDGDCAFCRCCVRVLTSRIRPSADVVAYQSIDVEDFGLTQTECADAVQWSDESGNRSGARAVAAVLAVSPKWRWRLASLIIDVRPMRPVSRLVYRSIAANRSRLVQFCRE